MKKIKSKWWVGLLILLFIIINLLVTNLNETKRNETPINDNIILEGNIDTH